MKNIMFLVDGNEGWIGGIYYVKNIMYSLLQNEKTEDAFNIYVYINKKFKPIFEVFSKYSNIKFIEFEGKTNRIELLNVCLDKKIMGIYPITNKYFNIIGDICINWIPDFQHVFLPEMFSEKEIKFRDEQFLYIATKSKKVVLSSNDAKDTYEKLYPNYIDKVIVMPFASYIEDDVKGINDEFIKEVLKKYKINDKFIYLPNQFWRHKNHIVVFKAMNHLINELKLNIQLVCTGNKNDYRNKQYFNKLEDYININNLNENIKILGLVSREEQLAIMKASKLIVQSSLFEGWGTVLEEAKFFNKRILLSNIPVHYEQKSKRSVIFDKNNYMELAKKITKYYNEEEIYNNESPIEEMTKKLNEYSEIAYELFDNTKDYIPNIELIEQYRKKLKYIFESSEGKTIAIYGTGDHTVNMMNAYERLLGKKKFKIIYLDSNFNKRGEKFLDERIYHEDDILDLRINKIVISSYEFQSDIYENIKEYENQGIEIVRIYDKEEDILFI